MFLAISGSRRPKRSTKMAKMKIISIGPGVQNAKTESSILKILSVSKLSTHYILSKRLRQ